MPLWERVLCGDGAQILEMTAREYGRNLNGSSIQCILKDNDT
jgi:hypothetical protein